jgi:hypothetical protein
MDKRGAALNSGWTTPDTNFTNGKNQSLITSPPTVFYVGADVRRLISDCLSGINDPHVHATRFTAMGQAMNGIAKQRLHQ